MTSSDSPRSNSGHRPPASGACPDPSLDLALLAADERQAWITAYLDDEVTAGQALAIQVWLDASPEALRTVEQHRRVWDLLDHYPDEPVSANFADRVLATTVRVESPSPTTAHAGPARMRLLRIAPLAAAATLLLAIGLGFALGRGGIGASPTDATDGASGQMAMAQLLDNIPADALRQDDVFHLLVDGDEATFSEFISGSFDDLVMAGAG